VSTDDRFDQESQEMQEILRLAQFYNEPPPTPRDAIWSAIQERRKVRALPPVWQRRPVWAVAAAVALVVLGVGLGRMTVRPPQPQPQTALSDAPQRASNTAQRIYTASHLGRSEAFLTQFAATPPADSDPELAGWARSLLTDTRLLLDAEAGLDPETVELLRDLEFVLVQIAHASESPEERQWVTEGMEQRAVMDRLRVLMTPRRQVPAGI
jgi:hypothetical protein